MAFRIKTRIFATLLLTALMGGLASGQAPSTTPQPGVVSAGTGNPYNRARQLPARIMDFKAEPDSIKPGESVTLTWSTENPTGVTIDPNVGRVTPRGILQLSPGATTIYTLTVHGPNDQTLTRMITVNVAGSAPPVEGTAVTQTLKKDAPRLADGRPDLSGIYDPNAGPRRGGPGNAPGPEGPVLKPGAEKFKVVRGPDDAGQYSDCMPLAGPQGFSVPYQFQLVQNPHYLAILHGYPGTFRIVPTDGGLHPTDPDPTWMGDSIGHWKGDTLVVDTIGFNDKTEINGYRHTDALHIIERFRRADYNTLQYDVTLEDPNVFVKPWTMSRTFALRTDLTKVDEFVCEHNPDYSKYFEKK